MSVSKGRIRWQCRRALLELDLVFARFLERHFDLLGEDQLAALDDLLRCEDHDLLAMVNGRKPCAKERWKEIIALLRQR